jgi:hypothetical protein
VASGEGELALGLDADAAQHGHVFLRALACVLEQGGLADSGLAADDEDTSPAGAGVSQKAVDLCGLRAYASEPGGGPCHDRAHGGPMRLCQDRWPPLIVLAIGILLSLDYHLIRLH